MAPSWTTIVALAICMCACHCVRTDSDTQKHLDNDIQEDEGPDATAACSCFKCDLDCKAFNMNSNGGEWTTLTDIEAFQKWELNNCYRNSTRVFRADPCFGDPPGLQPCCDGCDLTCEGSERDAIALYHTQLTDCRTKAFECAKQNQLTDDDMYKKMIQASDQEEETPDDPVCSCFKCDLGCKAFYMNSNGGEWKKLGTSEAFQKWEFNECYNGMKREHRAEPCFGTPHGLQPCCDSCDLTCEGHKLNAISLYNKQKKVCSTKAAQCASANQVFCEDQSQLPGSLAALTCESVFSQGGWCEYWDKEKTHGGRPSCPALRCKMCGRDFTKDPNFPCICPS